MTDFDTNDGSSQEKRFVVPYSLDPEQFFRLECPDCALQFKVMAEAISLADGLSPAFKQIEAEHDISLSLTSDDIAEESTNWITCPYCGHRDEPRNFNTREFVDHAVRWLNREFVHDILNQFSRDLDKTFNSGPRGRSGGLISISWEFKRHVRPKPVKPISGPELPDMKRVDLICCGKTIKIADAWCVNIFCPYCAQELALQ